MGEIPFQRVLAPIALLGLSVGAYVLVLSGGVPFGQEAGVILTVITGVATLGAVSLHEKIPALTAGVATLGFGLGVTMSGVVVTIAAALVVLGGVGFLVSTVYSIGARTAGTSPA